VQQQTLRVVPKEKNSTTLVTTQIMLLFYLHNIKSAFSPLKSVKYICFPTLCRTELTLFCCIQPADKVLYHCVK